MIADPYIRFSSAEQKRGGSLSRQTENITAYILSKGWTLGVSIIDDGRSGYKAEHRRADRGLGAFEREAEQGLHIGKVLVVERLDRLTRESPQKTWALISKLVESGVSIATVEGDKLYPAYNELDMLAILEVLFKASGNHEESAKKSAHISREWEKRRERAKANKTALTKLCPPWLSVDPATRHYRVIPDRADLIARWFEMADSGLGALTIAKAMAQEGVEPWKRFEGREAKVWQRSFISRVLANREVLGEYQPKREGKPDGEPWIDHLPAIVGHDVFARVNASAQTRKELAGGRKSTWRANILAGLCKCAACGATMSYAPGRGEGKTWVSAQGRKYSYKRPNASLVCPVAQTSKGLKCSNRAHWAYLTLEDSIVRETLHLAMDDNAFANSGEAVRLVQAIAESERNLELLKVRENRLWSAYADGNDGALTLANQTKAEREACETNIASLKQEQAKAMGRVSSADHLRRVQDIAANLWSDDLDERTKVRAKVQLQLATLIQSIVLSQTQAFVRFEADAGFLYLDRRGKLLAGIDTLHDGNQSPQADVIRKRRDMADKKLTAIGELGLHDLVTVMTNQPKVRRVM